MRQKQDDLGFGEAAVALKILPRDDVDFALSKQFDYAYLQVGKSALSGQLVAAYKLFSRVAENLRAKRSQLMLRWLNNKPNQKTLYASMTPIDVQSVLRD